MPFACESGASVVSGNSAWYSSEEMQFAHLAAELLSQLRRCTRREHIDLWVAPRRYAGEALRGDLGLAVLRRAQEHQPVDFPGDDPIELFADYAVKSCPAPSAEWSPQ